MNVFILLRMIVGGVLVVSGFEKLIGPYQNFLYVINAYEFLPAPLAYIVARAFPWVEFFVGVFTVLGLWTKESVTGCLALFLGFITVVSQALIRHLPINECGCFGELASLPPQAVLIMDSCLLIFSLFSVND